MTPSYGPRFAVALAYAASLHAGQRRKGDEGIPYVGHLLGVCALVIEDGGDEDEAIGALLHDAVEDQGGLAQAETIRTLFGDRVARIVDECTDAAESPKPPWIARKRAYLDTIPEKSDSGSRVSLADKLYNAGAIHRDHRQQGERVWKRFDQDGRHQLGYYGALARAFTLRRPGPMADELRDTVDWLTKESGVEPLRPEDW